MNQPVRIGIIGDFSPDKPSHQATMNAIYHAANYLSLEIKISWLPTPSMLKEEAEKSLKQFNCLWASPGSPYQSPDGALRGIRLVRVQNIPFFGT